MGRPLSQYADTVFNAVACEPSYNGCDAGKGERCHTKAGKALAYPHAVRRSNYNHFESQKKRPGRAEVVTNHSECLVRKGGCGAPAGSKCVGRTGARVTGGYHTVREKIWEGQELEDVPEDKQKPYYPFGDEAVLAKLPKTRSSAIDSLTHVREVTQEALDDMVKKSYSERVATVEGSLHLLLSFESTNWLLHHVAKTLVDLDWDLRKAS